MIIGLFHRQITLDTLNRFYYREHFDADVTVKVPADFIDCTFHQRVLIEPTCAACFDSCKFAKYPSFLKHLPTETLVRAWNIDIGIPVIVDGYDMFPEQAVPPLELLLRRILTVAHANPKA